MFIDDLPKSHSLKVRFEPKFYLEQPDDVSDDVFNLIKNHYEHLDLLERFRGKGGEIINNLKAIIKGYKGLEVNIGDKINEQCKDLEAYLGYNYRQVVIYLLQKILFNIV